MVWRHADSWRREQGIIHNIRVEEFGARPDAVNPEVSIELGQSGFAEEARLITASFVFKSGEDLGVPTIGTFFHFARFTRFDFRLLVVVAYFLVHRKPR